jgi:hypothetical protein
MTTHTHTQGPWHLGKRGGNPAIYGKDGTEVAEILHGLTPEWRGNARLIAAAPEMLEALREMLSMFGDHEQYDEDSAQVISQTRQVIARVEGSDA